ncbi:MAG: collagenase [Bacteroidetes bacterium 4572_128]|nr:MAG: collagenase [Bacteroidetes bacterium 4572_128]
MQKNIEIMSPVGSYESLMGAIQAGANSVYFGIEKLNMRAKSSINFKLEDIEKIVKICKKFKVKTYLTLNVVIYDKELEDMKIIVNSAKKNGIDAIIASDMAVINYSISQNMPVHISTQVNITNIESVKFYSKFSDVMVMARELNLEQIKNITDEIKKQKIKGISGKNVKIEIFIHGALCMAVSGKCYLSLHENNFSANRGNCLQTCRKSYIVTEKETNYQLEIDNEYIMSPKDLCTIDFLDKILDTGVSVLKIEGRARSPEYVKFVTKSYVEAINLIKNGNFNEEKFKILKENLKKVFNRGFWGGYYMGKKIGEWSDTYGSKAKTKKFYIGKGKNYFKKIKVAEFLLQAGDLKVGDEILITGPTTGVINTKVKEIRVNLEKTKIAKKGEICSIAIEKTVRASDKLYIIK